MINVLFVCRYNRYRSQFAEAFFNKINVNKNLSARSAGLIRGEPLDTNLLRLAKKNDLQLKGQPEGLSQDVLKWQNIIVVIADNVPKSIFIEERIKTDRVIKWNIDEEVESLGIIERKVAGLFRELSRRVN